MLEVTEAKKPRRRDKRFGKGKVLYQNEHGQKYFFLYCFLLVLEQVISKLDFGEAMGEMHLK